MTAPAEVLERRIWEALRTIDDPEMPINLVDLGLVYRVEVDGPGSAQIDLTFTAMGCPATDFILEDIHTRLAEIGVGQVKVNIVWDPPWTSARLTPDGRDALEMWGLAV